MGTKIVSILVAVALLGALLTGSAVAQDTTTVLSPSDNSDTNQPVLPDDTSSHQPVLPDVASDEASS